MILLFLHVLFKSRRFEFIHVDIRATELTFKKDMARVKKKWHM